MNTSDLEFIEKFYTDIERGYSSLGKTYIRPDDYIERALKVLYGKRKPLSSQHEGKTGMFHEEN